MTHLLSDGSPSTLGSYYKLSIAFFGADSEAVKFLDKKISESPLGEEEPVLADETQMVYVLMSMEAPS